MLVNKSDLEKAGAPQTVSADEFDVLSPLTVGEAAQRVALNFGLRGDPTPSEEGQALINKADSARKRLREMSGF